MAIAQQPKGFQLKEGKTAVSALQEMLQKRGVSTPTYKEKGGGPPFTIYCQSWEISEKTWSFLINSYEMFFLIVKKPQHSFESALIPITLELTRCIDFG